MSCGNCFECDNCYGVCPDDKYQRLKELSRRHHTSVNRLFDEMATLMLTEYDAETRFQLRAERRQNKTARGIEFLCKAKDPGK